MNTELGARYSTRWLRSGCPIRTAPGDSATGTGRSAICSGPCNNAHLRPEERFKVASHSGRLVIDAESYYRYNTYVDLLVSLDSAGLVETYRNVRPLIDEAYQELGYGERPFEDVLTMAFAVVLKTPIVRGDMAVETVSVNYTYSEQWIEDLVWSGREPLMFATSCLLLAVNLLPFVWIPYAMLEPREALLPPWLWVGASLALLLGCRLVVQRLQGFRLWSVVSTRLPCCSACSSRCGRFTWRMGKAWYVGATASTAAKTRASSRLLKRESACATAVAATRCFRHKLLAAEP